MTTRVNFDVDEETKIRIDDVMSIAKISTKRRLFEMALDMFEKVHRLVSQNWVVVAVKSNQLPGVLHAAHDGVVIVNEPDNPTYRWLVARPGDWRTAPWIKGTRLHISDIMAMTKTDPSLSSEDMANDLKVPREAIEESLAYIQTNQSLIEAEEREAATRAKEIEANAVAP